MTLAPSPLIPGLDEVVKGDPKRRADAVRRIGELFLSGAANMGPGHVDLFDGVLINLVPHAAHDARVDLSERLSLLANAPRGLVGMLAREDEIAIAGPLLRRSPVIEDGVLVEIARIRGQGHLLAISERQELSPDVTDVIVRRGDRDTVRRAAGNAGARFSPIGYSALIKRACKDGVLTLTVGQRGDLSPPQLKDLLAGSLDIVRRRLFEVVKPARQIEIKQAMSEISGKPERVESRRDFTSAQRTILALHSAGALNEDALFGFAKAYKYEESIAALSAMSAVKIALLDHLISGERHDSILIIGRALDFEWATVRALILLRLGSNRVPSPTDIEKARLNFGRLLPSTAARMVRFWQIRQSA